MAFSMLAGQPIGRLVFALGGGAWLSPRLLTAEGALLAIGMQSQAVSDQGMITSNAGLVRFYQHQILHGEFLGAALFGPPTAASLPFWGDSMQVFHLFKQGSLFVTVSYQDASGAWVTLRVSNETISTGEYLWMQKLVTLPQVSFRAKEFGGYVALNWGSLTFLPDAFVDVSGNSISPPQKISVKAEWGATDLVSRLIFEGNAFLRSRNPDELGYDLFEREFKEKALEMGAEYGSTLALVGVNADVPGELTFQLDGALTHSFKKDDEVVIQPSNLNDIYTFTGTWSVLNINQGATQFTIAFTGVAATGAIFCEVSNQLKLIPLLVGHYEHAVLPRTGSGAEVRYYRPNAVGDLATEGNLNGQNFALYDDSVNLEDLTNWDSDISLRYLQRNAPQPFGPLSLVGTGSITTLQGLFVWACARLGLSLQLAQSGEPELNLNFCLTQQMNLIDLLDKVAGYCNHSFFIQGDELHLFNNATAQGDVGRLSDLDVFSLDYEYTMPSKSYVARWKRFQPGSKRAGAISTPVLEEVEVVAEVAGQVSMGDVRNYSDVFDQDSARVKSNLRALKAEREAMTLRLKVPLERLPKLGEKFSYQDNELNPPLLATGKVRSITFDFENDTIDLTAKETSQ